MQRTSDFPQRRSKKQSQRPTYCPCRNASTIDSSLLCAPCVRRALGPALERRHQVWHERNALEAAYETVLWQHGNEPDLARLHQQSTRLRQRLEQLRQVCGTEAVLVAQDAVRNEERQKDAQMTTLAATVGAHLHRITNTLQQHSLPTAIASATQHVRQLRFQWALQAFALHRLDIGPDVLAHRPPRGIGKINGLPLPHAGPELYGVLPPRELQSALRHVAALTHLVARCLCIPLPHPIRLVVEQRPPPSLSSSRDAVAVTGSTVKDDYDITTSHTKQRAAEPERCSTLPATAVNTTTTATKDDNGSLLSSLWSAATNVTTRERTLSLFRTQPHKALPQSSLTSLTSSAASSHRTTSTLADRLSHVHAAYLGESHRPGSSSYALRVTANNDDNTHFDVALQLLQNDIVALAIRAGVPIDVLWPAQAVLLNLHALHLYCQTQALTVVAHKDDHEQPANSGHDHNPQE